MDSERKIDITFGIVLVIFALAGAIYALATNSPIWIPLLIAFAWIGGTMIHGKAIAGPKV